MSEPLELALRLPLDGLALDVALRSRARSLGLFGPSGAGKTSVLEAICGWRREASGRLALGARTLLDSAAGVDLSPSERRVGYVPQDLLLFPHWSVRRNLEAGTRAGRGGAAFAQVVEVLELAPLLERGTERLSGGERQRVALGRALCSQPDLLLLDEPLASLDVALRQRVLALLLRVRDELGTRLVFVSHDATEVAALCDEVAVLRAGRIVAQGPPADVFAGPDGTLVGGAELESVLRGRAVEVSPATATLELGDQARLQVPRGALALGDEALVAVPADDVLVALERPRGISARNVLDARVVTVTPRGEEVVLRARLEPSGVALVAALTPAAVQELELVPGRAVVLLIKTRACRLLAALAG